MVARLAGYDEVAQGVRLNDAMGEVQGVEALCEGFGVEIDGVARVAMTRAAMMLERGGGAQHMLASTWMDGFLCAMHLVEQAKTEGVTDDG